MKRLILIPIILLSFCMVAMGQRTGREFTVTGVVLDDMGESLPGASIYLKDKPGVGTITDVDGKFSIKVAAKDVIVVSYIGYENVEHYVAKQEDNLVITMSAQSEMMDEVVITGLGSVQRKVSVVGAVTTVEAKQLQTPGTSVNNMLGGRVPGIISMQNSGEPGDDVSEFWIRGIGTFGANDAALVLIDGLEGDLSQVDPADIESFSILKDAAATAVYGVRGANGVVLVTTKRGEEGKIQIDARANVTMSYLTRLPEYCDAYQYALLANEARVVRGNTELYDEMALTLIQRGLDPDLYPNVDWQSEIQKRASFKQSYYASIRGGGNVARYFVSLGASNEPAAYKQDADSRYSAQTGYNKYTFRSNVDINLTKSTKVYFGTEGFYDKNTMPGISSTNYLWQAQATLTPLTIPLTYSTGEIPAYGTTNSYSPYVMLNHTGLSTYENTNMKVTLSIDQDLSKLLDGLRIRAQGAFTNTGYFAETRSRMPDMYYATGRTVNGDLQLIRRVTGSQTTYSNDQSNYRKFHFESTLNYDKVFADIHRVSFLAYYYLSDEKSTADISTYANYIPTTLAALPIRYQAVSSRLSYTLNDTYIVDLSFGYTGSENFQPGRQYGFFPSIAVGWIPTQYQFMQDGLPWLDFWKIRFSYGSVGNDRITGNTRFPYLTTFTTTGAGWGGSSGLTEDNVGADNLMWEKALKTDLGIDMHLFRQAVNLTADVFYDKRDGIFQQREQVPSYVGLVTMPYGNVGSMISYGSDGNISYTHQINKNSSFTLRANYTYAKNRVLNWEQATQTYDYQNCSGWPNGVVWGYISLGLFSDEDDVLSSPTQFGTVLPGDIKYKDVNGDGQITEDDKVPLSLTNNYPSLMYGFGGEFQYKQFTFGVLFKGRGYTPYYVLGIYDDTYLYDYTGVGYIPFYSGATGNVLTIVADQENRWTPASYSGDASTENPNAIFPRLDYGYNENNYQISDFWLRDGRYLQIQEVSINYNAQIKALQTIGIRSIDFQLVANNLYSFDKVKLFHPEQAWRNGVVYPLPLTVALQVYIHM